MSAPPPWLARIAAAATDLDPTRLSRLLPPPGGTARAAAVLILVAPGDDGERVLLLQRSDALRSHAGQVAFPGGAAERDDADPVATALREAGEEAGVVASQVQVLASWPQVWIPVSDFAVTPVLGWWPSPRPVRADGSEMVHGALVALRDLADPAHRFTVITPSGWRGPGFEVDGLFVWGFTAGLLDALLRFGGWSVDWDPDARVVPAPLRPTGAAPRDDLDEEPS